MNKEKGKQLARVVTSYLAIQQYNEWAEAKVKTVPPPFLFKVQVLLRCSQVNETPIMVETGTYQGSMLIAVASAFKELYSVELGYKLYLEARERIIEEGLKDKIHLQYGSSVVRLPKMLEVINENTLFWLDAHYSGGDTVKGEKNSYLMEELEVISSFKHTKVIMIDDVRHLGTEGYPTIKEVADRLTADYPGALIYVTNDMFIMEKG